MLNQFVVVGRLVKEVEIKEEGEKKVANITLAIPRSFKNINGEYDTDFITCILWNAVAENTKEYCHKGDIVGIKGRLQKGEEDDSMQVIAEKVTFLSSKKDDKEDD